MGELQADVVRQQRILMNVSRIEARDQAERDRRQLDNASLREPKPIPQPAQVPEPESGLKTPPPPLNRQVPSNLPKTGPDRSDEPEAWSPCARTRARLLRYLSSFVGTSVKRLFALLNFIRWRISITKAKPSKRPDDPPPQPPPESILLRSNNESVCPSYVPRVEHVTLDIPHDQGDDHDEPYTTTVHSPSPTRTSFSGRPSPESPSSRDYDGPYTTTILEPSPTRTSRTSGQVHLYAESRSSRAISIEETPSDSRSVNSRLSARPVNPASTSAIALLPISTHGLNNITAGPVTPVSLRSASPRPSRPASRNSQVSHEPIKVSRAPSPNRASTPPPPPPAPSTAESPSRSSSPEKGWDIAPMSTATVQRWKRGVVVEKCPEGWAARIHAEGALYFFHKEKRIYTDAHMYDPTKATIINEAASQIFGRLQQEIDDPRVHEIMPKEYDLVLEIVNLPDGGVIVGYYFADHTSKLLFWMEEFDASKICSEIRCVVSIAHLRLEIESQYWTHCELYPNCRHYDQETVDEVRGILLHATTDTLTSTTSTALWTTEQNKSLLSILNHVKVKTEADRIWAGAIIEHTQFIHLYGEYGARLDRDQSIHGITVHPHSWYLKVIEPFLFWGAEVHLVALEKIWVDRTVHIEAFRHFIHKLNEEWQDFIIVATVLLNANMAFLSIQSVDTGGNFTSRRTAAQIVSYISIVTSLGSAILSLLLVRQNRSKGREAADKAATFLGNMTHGTRGLEHLAILYALPYALLMWSYVYFSPLLNRNYANIRLVARRTLTFLGAFALEVFVATSLVTRVDVGAVLAICTILVFWCILAAWICDSSQPHVLGQLKTRLGERAIVLWDLLRLRAGGSESAKDGGEENEKGDHEERKPSEESNTVCATPTTEKGKRKKSRSLSLRFFVRKATGDSGPSRRPTAITDSDAV
ncbi:hypothetical protein HWV62_21802 [Athelia sp. TMB]|nr:hypothetical protein HWV62_21802 [Athelia sp. TMB]